jgi:Ion channel
MVIQMSLLLACLTLLFVLSLLSALFLPWHFLTVMLLLGLSVLLTASIPVHLAWSRRNFGFLLIGFTGCILYSIFAYAVVYHRTGLLVGGIPTQVNFSEALYFSVTTWATLGYGDYTACKQYQLVTSAEVLTGYFSMAMLIALVTLWITEALRAYDQYVAELPQLAKAAIERLAEKSPEMKEKLKPLLDEMNKPTEEKTK